MDILVIVDMQEASFQESDKYDQIGVISRINLLSHHVRKNSGKVIFIQHDGTQDDGLKPCTEGWGILKALTREDTDLVVRKTTNDAFCGTDLKMLIDQTSFPRIILSGWATDFCVDTTLRSAVSQGYNLIAVTDCHTCSDRPHLKAQQVIEHHNWIWSNLISQNNRVEVLTLGQFLSKQKT